MKKKKQKVLAIVLVLVMCLQYFVPITALAAKKVEVYHDFMTETECFGYKGTYGNGCKVLIGKNNPKIGFCVQPGVTLAKVRYI